MQNIKVMNESSDGLVVLAFQFLYPCLVINNMVLYLMVWLSSGVELTTIFVLFLFFFQCGLKNFLYIFFF